MIRYFAATALALGFVSTVSGAPLAPAARAEVTALMQRLQASGCQFNRNGSWYSGEEAKAHLLQKLDYLERKDMVHSAEQFIALGATESSMSGKPYLVRCGSAAPVESKAWLSLELQGLRTRRGFSTGISTGISTDEIAAMSALASLKQKFHLRRQLRRPTGLRFAIADTLAQLNPAAWDAVTQGQSWFFSRDYLQMLEQVPPSCLQPRYGLISDAEGPIAAVVMQWAELSPERMRPSSAAVPAALVGKRARLRKLLGKAAAKSGTALVGRISERVLVCGNLLSYGMHAVAMAPDVAPEAVWPAVAELLYRVRRAEKLAGQAGFVLVKDVTDAQAKAVSALQGLSYRGVETEPNMVLALSTRWKTHADYLASLASKYRSSVRKQIMEPLRDAGLTLHAFEPDTALQARMHELYLQVHENASFRPFTLHAEYFGALARAAGARIRHAGVFDRDERLLGFIVTLLDGETAVAYHIGFDRAASADHPLYLGLLHASIGDAIAMGAKSVSLGRTALEPKARLGAKPQAMQVWVRHRQPVLNQLSLRLLGLVPHDEAPERNPFKTQE